MRRLPICVFAGSSFSMTGKYSDRAAQEYLIFLMMKRNFAGAVSSSTKVSGECFHCCAFAQADLNIFVSRSWQFYRSKHRLSQMNNGNSDQSACGMINGKKCELCSHSQV